MIRIASHGGGCCGIRHIKDFGIDTTKESIMAQLSSTRQHSTQGMLVEVVLTNRQCKMYPDHPRWLQELGFKVVSRFKNPNSGNICNVFHYNKVPKSVTSRLPFPLIN